MGGTSELKVHLHRDPGDLRLHARQTDAALRLHAKVRHADGRTGVVARLYRPGASIGARVAVDVDGGGYDIWMCGDCEVVR